MRTIRQKNDTNATLMQKNTSYLWTKKGPCVQHVNTLFFVFIFYFLFFYFLFLFFIASILATWFFTCLQDRYIPGFLQRPFLIFIFIFCLFIPPDHIQACAAAIANVEFTTARDLIWEVPQPPFFYFLFFCISYLFILFFIFDFIFYFF